MKILEGNHIIKVIENGNFMLWMIISVCTQVAIDVVIYIGTRIIPYKG